jgi:hypothetical protein
LVVSKLGACILDELLPFDSRVAITLLENRIFTLEVRHILDKWSLNIIGIGIQ